MPKFLFQEGVSYFQRLHQLDLGPFRLRLLVPNPDTVRFSYIMERRVIVWGAPKAFSLSGESTGRRYSYWIGPVSSCLLVGYGCIQAASEDRMMTTQNSVFLTGNSGVGKAGKSVQRDESDA